MVFVLIFFFSYSYRHHSPPQRLPLGTPTPPPPQQKNSNKKNQINSKRAVDDGKREKVGKKSVGAARKVSCDWLQEAMTCHSSNCFSIVYGQGNAPLVTSLPSSCYMRREKASSLPLPTILGSLLFLAHGQRGPCKGK